MSSEAVEVGGEPDVVLPRAPFSHESASFLHDPIVM